MSKPKQTLVEKIDTLRGLYGRSKTKPGAVALNEGEFDALCIIFEEHESLLFTLRECAHLLEHGHKSKAYITTSARSLIENIDKS